MTAMEDWPIQGLDIDLLRARLKHAREMFEVYAGMTQNFVQLKKLNEAMVSAQIAGKIAWASHTGSYVSPSLEEALNLIARHIDTNRCDPGLRFTDTHFSRKKTMHVVSRAWYVGGHTRLVERWINNTRDGSVHGIVLTMPCKEVPTWLKSAAESSGGWVYHLEGESSSLVHRAAVLRAMARTWADVVVVHADPNDALPVVAFGVDGGPGVVLLNHADHCFWLGASIADIVADIRPAGQQLTITRRGVMQSEILPIPLEDRQSIVDREELRSKFGFDKDSVVLLSIASAWKYGSLGLVDFLKVHKCVLDKHPNAVMLVVGPEDHGNWRDYKNATSGRIRALGIQSDLRPFHAISDVYIDSFPAASITSMLEAVQNNMAGMGIRNPLSAIMSADDPSLNRCRTHVASLEEYESELHRLIDDVSLREERGNELGDSVRIDHAPEGWKSHLEKVLDRVRKPHVVQRVEEREDQIAFDDLFLSYWQATYGRQISVAETMESHIQYLPAMTRCQLLLQNLSKKGVFENRRIKTKAFMSNSAREKLSSVKQKLSR